MNRGNWPIVPERDPVSLNSIAALRHFTFSAAPTDLASRLNKEARERSRTDDRAFSDVLVRLAYWLNSESVVDKVRQIDGLDGARQDQEDSWQSLITIIETHEQPVKEIFESFRSLSRNYHSLDFDRLMGDLSKREPIVDDIGRFISGTETDLDEIESAISKGLSGRSLPLEHKFQVGALVDAQELLGRCEEARGRIATVRKGWAEYQQKCSALQVLEGRVAHATADLDQAAAVFLRSVPPNLEAPLAEWLRANTA